MFCKYGKRNFYVGGDILDLLKNHFTIAKIIVRLMAH